MNAPDMVHVIFSVLARLRLVGCIYALGAVFCFGVLRVGNGYRETYMYSWRRSKFGGLEKRKAESGVRVGTRTLLER